MLKDTETRLKQTLKKYFGFDSFKGNQLEAIGNLLDGNDTFVIMPTGGGKSMCYQLPSLMLDGFSIVVSPLIALMKNQVDLIRGYSAQDSIAHFLNSTLNKTQETEVKEDIKSGKCKLIYVAPETLTKEENITFFKQRPVSFFAVDEAHCISEWGHDFRPEYRKIYAAMNVINPSLPVMVLTATATNKVRADIIKNLKLKEPTTLLESFNRPNLNYSIVPKINKEQTTKVLIKFLLDQGDVSGIVYTTSRKATEELAEVLCANDFSATSYHAGLDAKTRTKRQDDFLNENTKIIVATIAFGMGIDKPDVRFVVHYNLPKSIENYYQETGRAGRDGLPSNCLLLYSKKDILKLEVLIKDKPYSEREITHQLIYEMAAYSETGMCRRKFLLHYFGEIYKEDNCKNCDNCLNPKEVVDVKKEVSIAFKVISKLEEKFNSNHIINILLGRENSQTKMYRHKKLDIFGIGKDKDEVFWESVIRNLIFSGLLNKNIEDRGILKKTSKAEKFIRKPASFKIYLNHSFDEAQFENEGMSGGGKISAFDEKLYNILKSVQKGLAKKNNIPPYVVISEVSLTEMSLHYPTTLSELEKIQGVGKAKAHRYGKPFLDVISNYVEENNIEKITGVSVKSVTNKNALKISIIQDIDKKIPLDNTAKLKGKTYPEIIKELEGIVLSGTKVNIDYEINSQLSEEDVFEAMKYFKETETDDIDLALRELGEEYYTIDQLRLLRIKFINDNGL